MKSGTGKDRGKRRFGWGACWGCGQDAHTPRLIVSRLRFVAVAVVVLLLFLGSPAGARAHANLVRSQPPANSVAAEAPALATLWFDDALEAGLNAVSVLDGDGKTVSTGAAQMSGDRLVLTVPLQPGLPHGTYTVAYRTVSTSDGHNVRGFYIFSVGAPGAGAAGAQAVPRIDWSLLAAPVPALVAWLSIAAALTLTGGLFLTGFMLASEQGGNRRPEGRASTGTDSGPPFRAAVNDTTDRGAGQGRSDDPTLVRRVLAGSALALIAVQVAALAVYTAGLRDLPLASPALAAHIPATLTSSRFGAVWLVRLALTLTLLAVVVWLPARSGTRRVARVQQFVLAALGAAVLLSFSAQSHSAAVGQSAGPLWPVLMDWLHLLAAAVWFGGVFFLVAAGAPRMWLAEVVRPFGVWVLLAVGVLAVTGSYQTGVQAPQPVALHDTAYGWVLTAKQALIMLALVAGVAARQALARGGTQRAGTLLLRSEAVLAAAVLLAAAWLANTGPPREALAAAARLATPLGVRPAGDLLTAVALRPRPEGDWEVEVWLRDGEENALPNAARVTVGAGVLGNEIGWSSVALRPQGFGRYSAPVQWLHTDGRWGVYVTVRRRGVADDVTALYGVGVAGRQLTPLQYSTGAQPLYVGATKSEDFWGLVEFVEDSSEDRGRRSGGDAYITLTDPSGGYLDWVQRVRVSAAPNIGPGGAVGDAPGYQDTEGLGPGRFLLRNVTMSIMGDWTMRVQLAGRGQDAAAEGFFTFLVAPDGVRSLGGDFPPGHH